MSSPVSRLEQKQRTRRAILDATLRLTEEVGFAGLSLRQVAREVGIVPTAFYRHFGSLNEVGLTLVEESFVALRTTMREARQGEQDLAQIVQRSVDVLDAGVRSDPDHFAFISRERAGGLPLLRDAIRLELGRFERDLAADLATTLLPSWNEPDLDALCRLIVSAMITTAEEVLRHPMEDGASIRRRARTQLRLVIVGAAQWSPALSSGAGVTSGR